MGKKDFSSLEDQIMETVKSAFDAINFATIKKDIEDKTESTVNEVKSNLKNKSQQFNEKMRNKINDRYMNTNSIVRKDDKKLQRYIAKRPVGRISGIIYTIFGYSGSGLFGISSLYWLSKILFSKEVSANDYSFFGVSFALFICNIGLTLNGRSLRKRVKRFKKYVECLEGKSYCAIEELASSIGMKNKFVVKDLKKMIELNMFPEGKFDEKQTYFMLNQETYENYMNAERAFKERKEEELRKQEQYEKEMNDPEKKELFHVIQTGKSYIEQIKSANDAIPQEEISVKLDKLQNIVTQIINYVEKNPQKLSEVNRFINHYLPMTLKLVNSYKELNNQPVQGENIKNAKNEIEKAIDSINDAFAKLLDDLFEEVAIDISTDISVLKTLFTQEGLSKKDFEK